MWKRALAGILLDRPAHTPFAALKILQEKEGLRGPACEPKTLKQFIQFLALS
ncbi:MAG: hypothetical protein P8X65_08540 [Syntrophobacterales bacterium]